MKCYTCERKIKNPYYLDGHMYGYQCYKLALAQKCINQKEIHNDEYRRKCELAVDIFCRKEFKAGWNKDFQESILKQWATCKKLTGKQFRVIMQKLSDIERIDLYLSLFEINLQLIMQNGITMENGDKYEGASEKAKKSHAAHTVPISSALKTGSGYSERLQHFMHDERLHEWIRCEKIFTIERRNKHFYIVNYYDKIFEEDRAEVVDQGVLDYIKDDAEDDVVSIKDIVKIA